jgi:hypothetical protein
MSKTNFVIASPNTQSSGYYLRFLEILRDRGILRLIRAVRLDLDLQTLYLQRFLLLICEVVLTKRDFGSSEPRNVKILIMMHSSDARSTYHFRASR